MKTIFFKLLLILFILLAIILLYQPTKEKDSLYKGKENEDVYVSVQVGDNIQKILLDDYLKQLKHKLSQVELLFIHVY